jgi:hypothetical protein
VVNGGVVDNFWYNQRGPKKGWETKMNDIVSKMLLVVFTVGITQFINILIRKRKILQYDVFSMPLLRFTPKQELE